MACQRGFRFTRQILKVRMDVRKPFLFCVAKLPLGNGFKQSWVGVFRSGSGHTGFGKRYGRNASHSQRGTC
jgi:hypothetical protein